MDREKAREINQAVSVRGGPGVITEMERLGKGIPPTPRGGGRGSFAQFFD